MPSLRPQCSLRLRFVLPLALFFVAGLESRLRAQANWAAVPSHVATNLWGVCHGGGQFVAVGEHGVILTSPDGLAWTPRPSGTTAWLTSVAYGFNRYVAVGADRTVLLSFDAITWTPFNEFTAVTPRERLNVVGFDHGRFLAYGERDFAFTLQLPPRATWFQSSPGPRPVAWWRAFATGLGRVVVTGETGLTVFISEAPFSNDRLPTIIPPGTRALSGVIFDRDVFTAVGDGGVILISTDTATWTAQPSGTTSNLQAIAAFNNTLVAVGTGGTILSQNELGAWTRRASPTAELLLAVAASDTTAITVGTGGTILRAVATPLAPTLAVSPASVTETLTGAASFVARARGSLPLSYQWSRNSTALPGETRADLIRTPLTAADAGSYTVSVTNSAGTITSVPATLALLPAPTPVVDATFQADATLTGTPISLLALPDGGVLVSLADTSARVLKLTVTGALDPAWAANLFDFAPSVLIAQPDGRILVGGSFASHNGQSRVRLLRLNRDGTLDSAFAPAPEAIAQPTPALAVQADGKILVANGGPVPLRLLADGRLDSSFQPQALPPVPLPPFTESRAWTARVVDVASDGAIYIGYLVSLTVTLMAPRAEITVVRFLPGGAVDPSFSPPRRAASSLLMRALDDHGVILITTTRLTNSSPLESVASRFSRDGTALPTYQSPSLQPFGPRFIYPDGRLLSIGNSQSSPVRYIALGTLDPTFTGGVGNPTAFAATAGDRVFVAGNFTLYDGIASNRVARLNAVRNDTPTPPRILGLTVDRPVATHGESITVRAAVTGSGALTYDWTGEPSSYSDTPFRTASPTINVPIESTNQRRWVQLTVRNNRGEATSARLDLTVLPAAPVITQQPTRISAQSGRQLTLTISANFGSGNNEFFWHRDGQPLLASDRLVFYYSGIHFPSVAAADAGTYRVTLRNATGATIMSAPIVLTIDDSSRFVNLSTRAFVGAGEQVAIAGFVVAGPNTRRMLIRGVGPGLAPFGVVNPLPDPQLALFDANGKILGSYVNDDWTAGSTDAGQSFQNIFRSVGAFTLEPGSKDAVLIGTLAPGTYTAQLSGKPGQTGTALLEIYEADNDAARILNLSTRALVTPAAPVIAGFVIQGPVAKEVLVRAAGPALTPFGVAAALPNPRLEIRDGRGVTVARNEDWEVDSDRSALLRAFQSTGAFPFPTGSRDAAVLARLPPGNYSAIVDSAPAAAGLVLVEVYELP
ncbi:MAG: hypothetical protein Q8N18_13885 [Opitutaceae bacterium]|nr:hypothetical protein [Opitutaceae bacterium]